MTEKIEKPEYGKCPICKSEDIDFSDTDNNEGEHVDLAYCMDCGAQWDYVYEYVGIRNLKEGSEESEEESEEELEDW